MIRETLSPGSRHVSLFATPRTERDLAFQRRRQTDGISVHTAGPAVAPPGWLTLGRVGDTIAAYYRASATDAWTLVGRETIPGLPASVLVGLAVTSHVDGTLATARFDNVMIETGLLDASQDVGAVVCPEAPRSTASCTTCARPVRTSGQRRTRSGSSITARPAPGRTRRSRRPFAASRTPIGAKAGVMFRESPPVAQSPHVTVVVTPGRGVAMQYRPAQDRKSVV